MFPSANIPDQEQEIKAKKEKDGIFAIEDAYIGEYNYFAKNVLNEEEAKNHK